MPFQSDPVHHVGAAFVSSDTASSATYDADIEIRIPGKRTRLCMERNHVGVDRPFQYSRAKPAIQRRFR